MAGKKILYQDDARRALIKGMNIMVEAVSVTLGPKGRNVVLEKFAGSPQIINDGVSIAREIELEDNIENTGVSLIRQAAAKTNDVAIITDSGADFNEDDLDIHVVPVRYSFGDKGYIDKVSQTTSEFFHELFVKMKAL